MYLGMTPTAKPHQIIAIQHQTAILECDDVMACCRLFTTHKAHLTGRHQLSLALIEQKPSLVQLTQ
jgi:hypothetical protein